MYNYPYAIVMKVSYAVSDITKYIYVARTSFFEYQKQELSDTVIDIYNEYQKANWDDEGALPVTLQTLKYAGELVESLPDLDVKLNAFVTKSGKIGIQCIRTEAAISLVIESSGNITYAAIFPDGTNKHGYEIFSGTLPSDIREYLFQISKFN